MAALAARPGAVDWLEVLIDNHLEPGDLDPLLTLRRHHPLALHAVSMNLGGTDPIDVDHVRAIGARADRLDAAVVSDHLAFTAHGGRHLHDLLPIPLRPEVADHVADRVARVQDLLGRRILVENPSRYLAFEADTLDEAAFVERVVERADCGLLLDLNNVYVSARNLGHDARAVLDRLPLERVGQVHLAGHADRGTHLIDDHGGAVADPVHDLLAALRRRRPQVPVMIEWDTALPSLDRLLAEADRLRPKPCAAVA